jgi:hypothetical protein
MGLPSLYKLASQHHQLEAIGTDEDLDEAALEAIRNTLEGLEGEIEIKAQSVAAHCLNLEAYAKAAKEASKQLAQRAQRIERRADALREYMRSQLEALGLTKIDGPEFTVAIRKNPASVLIAPEADLGDEWMVFPEAPPPTPDKRKIGEALKAGKSIPGCSLSQTTRLDIRA